MFTTIATGETVGQVSRLAQYKNLQLRGEITDDPKLRMLGELALVIDILKQLRADGANLPRGLLYDLMKFASETDENDIWECRAPWEELREEERLLKQLHWDLELLLPYDPCECTRCRGIEVDSPPLNLFTPTPDMRAAAKRETTLREEGRRVRRRASEDEAEEPTPKRSLRNHRRANAELEALI